MISSVTHITVAKKKKVTKIIIYWVSCNYSLILRCRSELPSLFWVFRSWLLQQNSNLKYRSISTTTEWLQEAQSWPQLNCNALKRL